MRMITARIAALAIVLFPADGVARDAAQALADLKLLSADDMNGRESGEPSAERARVFIAERFEQLGLEPGPIGRMQRFAFNHRNEARRGVNVLGAVRGATTPEEIIVVTAHYDHLGRRGDAIFNGADDNASGVAALLALAESLTRTPPRRTIVFAALDAEELGLHGAHALASTLPLERVRLTINLDMVARADDGLLYAVGARHYPLLKPALDAIAPRSAVRLAHGHDGGDPKQADWTFASDHAAFHERGVAFVYFGVEDHRDSHMPSDDFDRIDPLVFAESVAIIEEATRALDATDLPSR